MNKVRVLVPTIALRCPTQLNKEKKNKIKIKDA